MKRLKEWACLDQRYTITINATGNFDLIIFLPDPIKKRKIIFHNCLENYCSFIISFFDIFSQILAKKQIKTRLMLPVLENSFAQYFLDYVREGLELEETQNTIIMESE